LSFVLVYSSTLNYQKEAFIRQAAVLTHDLKNVVTNERKKVYLNTFFKNSTVYANTSRNYPILSKIVPPNDGLYFPNYVWFNTSSNLGVEMAPLIDTDMSKNQKVVSNHFYDIY
ncbi:glucosyltransferase domain-containing protein, partial [Enterococcus faecalis]